jgi:voltage-gated potassium channel
MLAKIRYLYTSHDRKAQQFRYVLLALDALSIAFFIVSSFYFGHPLVENIDKILGTYIALDLAARFIAEGCKTRFFLRIFTILDILVIISCFAPQEGHYLAFLRAFAITRLFRSYCVLHRLRNDVPYFKKNEDTVINAINLIIFIFVMTEIVLQTQIGRNPHINHFIDALYFTITTLTTTGFGDITLQGTDGRILAIITMICGVTLFLRLIRSLVRPNKVYFPCPACGLYLHDRDAVHCKHCGTTLNIPDEGHV